MLRRVTSVPFFYFFISAVSFLPAEDLKRRIFHFQELNMDMCLTPRRELSLDDFCDRDKSTKTLFNRYISRVKRHVTVTALF